MAQTKHQPLVLIVKAKRSFDCDDLDSDSDAFAGLLRVMHSCDSSFFRHTFHLSNYLAEKESKLKVPSRVVALIIYEEEYDWDIISEILLLRKEHSFIKNVPTIVVSRRETSIPLLKTANFLNGRINKVGVFNSELINLVGRLVAEWVITRDWLGIDYTEKCPEILDVLEAVYLQNQDDSNYSVPVDQNHMVVAEALRIKLLPGEIVGKRYDEAFKKKYVKFKESDPSLLTRDLKKICEMSSEEKDSFISGLIRTQGTVGGYGPSVDAFAIDAVTLEFLIGGHGKHNYVNSLLKTRLERMNHMRRDKYSDDKDYVWRFFEGLIYRSPPGMKTPILKMYFYKEDAGDNQKWAEDVKRISDFLKSQKKFIIVDHNCQLL